jgi:hypothetical protein
MMMRTVSAILCLAALAACTPRQAVVVPDATPAKRITYEGSNLKLPDGTRVTPDSTGGFSLPNGDYVRRDARGALLLPTGARCLPDAGGYTCP